jgi:hypothetical protein
MTGLEQTLAAILKAIEDARGSGNPHALVALMRRRDAICAALAGPEQAWLEPATVAMVEVAQRKAA